MEIISFFILMLPQHCIFFKLNFIRKKSFDMDFLVNSVILCSLPWPNFRRTPEPGNTEMAWVEFSFASVRSFVLSSRSVWWTFSPSHCPTLYDTIAICLIMKSKLFLLRTKIFFFFFLIWSKVLLYYLIDFSKLSQNLTWSLHLRMLRWKSFQHLLTSVHKVRNVTVCFVLVIFVQLTWKFISYG